MGQRASSSMWCRGPSVIHHAHLSFDLLFSHSDNCKVGLYCDTKTTVCVQQQAFGTSCFADKECSSYNCMSNQTCGLSPSEPRHFPQWIYAVIGIGIFGGGHSSHLAPIYVITSFFPVRYDCDPNHLVLRPRSATRG